jgi:DNA repair exonuclease SbcCD ATPase subunit
MRLRSATIEGFRGFTKKLFVDLDANVILMHGPNGVGKTSLLDAILWVLTGRIDRFGEKGSSISLYARERIARVELTLKDEENDIIVTRASDDERNTIRLRAHGEEHEGPIAERRLSECLLPQLLDRTEVTTAISNVLTRGVYLQQDLVRQFIETDTPAERFQLISEVIGAGAVLQLQSALEKSRLQWARNITSVKRERFEPLQQQLAHIDEQIARLEAEPPAQTIEAQSESAQLFMDAVELLGRSRLSQDEAPTSSSALDRLLKEIVGERASIERELTTFRALLQESSTAEQAMELDESQLQELVAREAAAVRELADYDAAVDAALEANARLQEQRLADRNRISRLSTMAQLALDELSDVCPVCQQQHNRTTTEHHLQELIAAAAKIVDPVDDGDRSLQDLNVRRNEARAGLEKIRNELRDVRTAHQEANARQSVYRSRLRDLGMEPGSDPASWLSTRATSLEERLQRIAALLRRGEMLTLSVIRLGEHRRRSEMQQERAALEPRIAELKSEIERLERTHGLAGRIIEALRRASLDVTRKQIESVQPLFQRIYSRMDPHPTFRLIQITTAMERGRGLLRTGVSDPDQGFEMHDALPILSSSQLNSFAVSLFLALNLGLPSLGLNLVMLDDPLQSLDSINLLGLIDVLRRFSEHRQLIVSTHETRLLGLLQRKLRPVRPNERMMTLYFDTWTRDGPDFRAVPLEFVEDEVRVLAAE